MPINWSFGATPAKPRADECPKCGRVSDSSDIHTLAAGTARRAFYVCAGCGLEWTMAWDSVDRAETVSADEVLSVHEALLDFEGPLTRLLEVPKP